MSISEIRTESVKEILPKSVKASECRLGDTVRTTLGPFSVAVVINITDTEIKLFRPYAITSDFSTTNGVIPYIGFEEYGIYLTNDVMLIERARPPR